MTGMRLVGAHIEKASISLNISHSELSRRQQRQTSSLFFNGRLPLLELSLQR